MLSEAEKKWLEDREQVEIANGLYSCAHCQLFSNTYSVYTGYCIGEYAECPIVPNFRDAAEFEARVAMKLALTHDGPEPCERNEEVKHCPWAKRVIEGKMTCKFCRLKHARLVVEEEMEKE